MTSKDDMDRWYQEGLDRLPEQRAALEAETTRLCTLLDGFTPAARRRLLLLTVRCEMKGCEIGRVYEFDLRGGGQRYLFRGRTVSGKPKNSVLNWPFSADWHAPVYFSAGCGHNSGKIGRAWLLDCIGAIRLWTAPLETVDSFLASLPNEMRNGRVSRVFHPPHEP